MAVAALTWHPSSDSALGWTPDGRGILFASGRTAYSRFVELFTVNLDGGYVSSPSSDVWSPDGHCIAENIGIIPDVEVELDPELVRQGKDPQLDKAIEIVMDELARNPLPKPKRPAYPDHHKKK